MAKPTPAEIRERLYESIDATVGFRLTVDELAEAANNAAQQIVFLLDEKESPDATK